jgi:hypothetical protein
MRRKTPEPLDMKNTIVLYRAWFPLIAICGLCFIAPISRGQWSGSGGGYPEDRKDAYVNGGSGGGAIYVGSVFWDYGTGRVQGVIFDSFDSANGWLDGYASQGHNVYYDQSSRNSCFDQDERCYDEEVVWNPIVGQTIRALSAAIPPKYVAVSDTVYIYSVGNEGTEGGTAVYSELGEGDNTIHQISHWFSSVAQANDYLQYKASQHAILIPPLSIIQAP